MRFWYVISWYIFSCCIILLTTYYRYYIHFIVCVNQNMCTLVYNHNMMFDIQCFIFRLYYCIMSFWFMCIYTITMLDVTYMLCIHIPVYMFFHVLAAQLVFNIASYRWWFRSGCPEPSQVVYDTDVSPSFLCPFSGQTS